ncbi:hypothetical protein NPIL_483031 [Nephila pilipes]|uniref:Uncharacterized protein n=1 Tax=Nephila pilipes TaxID=299642 RepID=A0A8X6UET9_NEPPI|nr:hypothetical protein NPIL_483031 [Nephila pilipes]
MKTRGSYSLASAEGKAIQEVQQVDPQWHPKEPRPFVVFAEWRLPRIDDDPHSKDYFYRFHFPMQTRADLISDAIPMYHRGLSRLVLEQCFVVWVPVHMQRQHRKDIACRYLPQ